MDRQANRSSTIFEDLPNEMIVAVLQVLNLPDLINCRAVSKRFRQLIDRHLQVQDLKILNRFAPSFFAPNFRYLLRPSYGHISRSASFQNFFSTSLKSMAVDALISADLVALNAFHNLERLHASKIIIDCNVRLSLPKLRTLFIEEISLRRGVESLKIESRSLENMNCRDLIRIELLNYDTVKRLTFKCGLHEFGYFALPMFNRLQILEVLDVGLLGVPRQDVDKFVNAVSTLDDLTELHFDSVRLEAQNLIDQTVKLLWSRKPALRIFWHRIELTKKNTSLIYGQRQKEEIFQIRVMNYQQLRTFPEDFQVIGYHHLQIFNKVPDDFFRAFTNIRCVYSGAIRDPDRFIRFVNSCKDLNFLDFDIHGLPRSFFGRLSLNRLTLHGLTLTGRNSQVDYSFIHKLDYLLSLRIYQALDRETLILFFKQCKYLRGFYFKAKKRPFLVYKFVKDSYHLIQSPDHMRKVWPDLNLKDLSELCGLILDDDILTRSKGKKFATKYHLPYISF